MRREDVHAEIGQIVAGRRPGRTAESETFVFDSTGMALQDAAACAVVIDRARQESRGFYLDFSTTNSFTSGGSNEVDHTSAAENRSHRVPLAD
jgi:hypothetical protein